MLLAYIYHPCIFLYNYCRNTKVRMPVCAVFMSRRVNAERANIWMASFLIHSSVGWRLTHSRTLRVSICSYVPQHIRVQHMRFCKNFAYEEFFRTLSICKSDLIQYCSKRPTWCYDSFNILLLILMISCKMCTCNSFAYFSSISCNVSAIYCPNELYLLTLFVVVYVVSWSRWLTAVWLLWSVDCCDGLGDDESSSLRFRGMIDKCGSELTQMRGKLSADGGRINAGLMRLPLIDDSSSFSCDDDVAADA